MKRGQRAEAEAEATARCALIAVSKEEQKMRKAQPANSTDDVVVQATEDLTERIRQHAYELYEAREKQDGHELEDWLLAESEVMEEIKH
jgi:hypothetical protein